MQCIWWNDDHGGNLRVKHYYAYHSDIKVYLEVGHGTKESEIWTFSSFFLDYLILLRTMILHSWVAKPVETWIIFFGPDADYILLDMSSMSSFLSIETGTKDSII